MMFTGFQPTVSRFFQSERRAADPAALALRQNCSYFRHLTRLGRLLYYFGHIQRLLMLRKGTTMNKKQRRIMLVLLAAVLFIFLLAGCQEKSAKSFQNITGTWQAGLMLPSSNDPAIADDPVATESLSYEINVIITETGINEGTLQLIDVMGEANRPFNLSATTTHDLYEIPFTFDPETDILSGEITTAHPR
jgi:hypothetical protein